MPKENRSDWVAVAPQFSSEGSSGGGNRIKPAQSAFTFWQKDNSEQVKAEFIASNNGKFEVGLYSRAMREKWNNLDATEKEPYEDLERRDKFRFRSESHQADVAAMERRERLQKERETLLLDDVGGTQRGTRGQHAHKERKEKRKEKKRFKKLEKKKKSKRSQEDDDDSDEDYVAAKKSVDDDGDFVEEDESSDDSYSGDSTSDSSDSDDSHRRKKKKAKPAPRKVSAKQLENRRIAQEEKKKKRGNYFHATTRYTKRKGLPGKETPRVSVETIFDFLALRSSDTGPSKIRNKDGHQEKRRRETRFYE